MRTHTSQFKNELKNMGRQIDSIITYGNTTLHDELYAVTPHFEASLLKSVMKQLDIESSVIIPIGTTVNYQLGVKVGNAYEYMNYGNYVVYSIEKIEDTDTYKIICYDKMLYSMKEYESLGVTYPINIRNFINALCTKVGLVFKDTATQFANYDKIIENELYLDVDGNSLGYTYRDVFDELAQVTASIICIDPATDKVQIKYPNQTNDTINEEFLKDVNVKFGEKYGPVNTIVLSRSAGADNVYYPDPLPQNPCEIKITDNQIMNWNDRDIYLPDIYNKLNGLEYYINDFSSTGILYYELGDFYNVSVGSTTYKCLMLNDEINITQGIEEIIHADMPEEAETDYTKADKTDRRINQTYLIVDKQNQKIEAVINTTQEIEHQFETLQDIDGFAEGKYIYLDDASDELITSAKFNGETSQATRSGKNLAKNSSFTENLSGWSLNGLSNSNIETKFNQKCLHIQGALNTTKLISQAINDRVEAGETYTISCMAYLENYVAGTTNPFCSLYFDGKDTNNNWIGSSRISGSSAFREYTYNNNYVKIKYTFKVPNNADLTKTYGMYVYARDFTGDLYVYNLQLEQGSENTDYEAYGVSPSPDYPSEIKNLEGKNIFDEVLENGGFTGTGLNAESYSRIRSKNYIPVQENTNYTISVGENNTGKTLQVSISYYDTNDYTTARLSYLNWANLNNSASFTTPANCKYIRFLLRYSDSSAITIDDSLDKFMIEKGTVATPYVPYNSLEVKVVNKNLLGLPNIAETSALGLQYSVNNGEITLNGTATSGGRISIPLITPIQCVNGTNYTLSKEATGTASNHGFNVQLRNAGSNIKNYTEAQLPQSFDNISSFINELGLYIGNGYSFTNYKLKLQLEQGVATEYEEHQEQTVYFPLAEGQKLYQGSYLADDGIHNIRKQIIFNGTENWGNQSGSYDTTDRMMFSLSTSINTDLANRKGKCNYFVNYNGSVQSASVDVTAFNFHPLARYSNFIYFKIERSALSTEDVAGWKTWVAEHNLLVEYDLAEEEVIPYNTDQQAAWNNIKSLHTYKTVTHIYSDAYAEIGYIKDNMLSAFETKASARLTQQDVQQLKIENGRISSEVSSTQSQFNNYYTKNEADNNTNSTKAELQNIIQQNKTEIEQTTQAINLRVSSIETNGVDKIETSMGYTFNNEGLNIDKEGAATASTIDNEAFKVKNKSANGNVFFAGYVSDQSSAYRGQTIVESTNLVVKNYLNIEGASRFQPYVNRVLGGHGTGAFDIG